MKSNVEKVDIDELKNVKTSLESQADKLDVDKLVPVSVDLNKLSDAVKNDAAKKDVYDAKIKTIEDEIHDITNLATLILLLLPLKMKIPNVSNLVKKPDHNKKN